MADFSVTVSNSVGLLGMGAPTLWGFFDWGTGFWGAGSNPMVFMVDKALDAETLTLADAIAKSADVTAWVESIAVTGEATDETLQDANGYFYVFTKPTLDAEDRNLTSYTEATPPATTWASGTVSGPTWSEQ